MVTNVLQVVFCLGLLWLFLKKSRRLPTLMIVWMVGALAIQAIDLALISQIPSVAASAESRDVGVLGRSVVAAGRLDSLLPHLEAGEEHLRSLVPGQRAVAWVT
jgi:hypothetical protein